MKHLIISLIFTSSVFAAPPSFALIESKEDAKRIAIGVENFLIKIEQSIDFYVGGVYNEHSIDGDIDKRNGHPIISFDDTVAENVLFSRRNRPRKGWHKPPEIYSYF